MRPLLYALFVAPLLAQTPTYQIGPFAGTYQVPQDVAAVSAVFSQPSAVAADSRGNVYIADTENYLIRRLGADGRVTVVAGTGVRASPGSPAAGPQLGRVVAMTLHQDRYLYFSERDRIRRFDLTAARMEGVSTTPIGDAVSLATAPNGDLWFVDAAAGTVRVIEPLGPTRVVVTGVTGGGGIAVDRAGNVYFAETAQENRSRLRRILASDPSSVTTAGALDPMTLPRAMAFDRETLTLYLADTIGHRIGRIDLASRSVGLLAGNSTPGFAGETDRSQVNAPGGITVLPDGALVFADTQNLRIRRLQQTGEISTLAGRVNSAGELVAAVTALVGNPAAVKVDSRGNVLITENSSCVVREVVAGGVISTLLGKTGVCRTMENPSILRDVTFDRPVAAVRDAKGNLFIAEKSGIWAILAKDRNARQIFRGTQVMDIELDRSGNYLYAVVTSLHIVVRININTLVESDELDIEDVAGNNQPGFSGEGGLAYRASLKSPTSIAFDSRGDLLIADAGNERLRRVTIANNAILTVAIVPGIQTVGADREGFIYVGYANRVARLDTSGPVVIAGAEAFGVGAESGNPLDARFTEIRSMATMADRSLLIADYQTHRVRRIQVSVPVTPPSGGGGGGGGGGGVANRPRILRTVTASNFGGSANLAAGSWIEIYGENLAPASRQWSEADFQNNIAPVGLTGVRVVVNDRLCFLQLVSPTQINAILPSDLNLGEVGLYVDNAGVRSDLVTVRVNLRAPALLAPPSFRLGERQYVAAQFVDGAFAGPPNLVPGATFRAARAGERLVLFGIGFGETSPPVLAGQITPGVAALPALNLLLGGKPVALDYGGLAVGYVGLFQFNIVVPDGLSGDLPLTGSSDGTPIVQGLALRVE